MKKTKLYFAYGSNMNQQRLEERVGPVVNLGVTTLSGFVLMFNAGYDDNRFANIKMTGLSKDVVQGVLYELTPKQLRMLDKFEGAPYYYQRMVWKTKGREMHVYICINPLYTPHPSVPIKKEYLNHIAKGYADHNITTTYIGLAISRR
jgi:gamma-glutamylcyclotransferase (GGCT)/AIG2-like uncharacterized protein YtfP